MHHHQATAERNAALAASSASPAVQQARQSLPAHADDGPAGPSDDFLALPAAAAPGFMVPDHPALPGLAVFDRSADAPPLCAGQRLGAWLIDGLVDRGGRGEVWSAHRAAGAYLGRAAIKALRTGLDSRRGLARFGQEQQALAQLNPPHAAHLLDAGRTSDGQPCFVMEAADGLPIDRPCSGRGIDRRLAVFLHLAHAVAHAVVHAVAHAHRQLRVHRDLKPGVLLVADDGGVKLQDFGFAKAIDPLDGSDGRHTVASDRPFTPHCASPEPVRGEPVGTATDIYRLGVLRHVMLTGTRPDGRPASTALEAARCVLHDEPTRPSALSPGLVADPLWLAHRKRRLGDLDNSRQKALDKRSAHRLPSVDALATDVQAHLAGYPVSARPPGAARLTWRSQTRPVALFVRLLPARPTLPTPEWFALSVVIAPARRACRVRRVRRVCRVRRVRRIRLALPLVCAAVTKGAASPGGQHRSGAVVGCDQQGQQCQRG